MTIRVCRTYAEATGIGEEWILDDLDNVILKLYDGNRIGNSVYKGDTCQTIATI